MNNYKENYNKKLSMKLSANQLDRIALTLFDNPENKKFAGNVLKLLKMVNLNNLETTRKTRIILVQSVAEIILNNNISSKEAILDFISPDGVLYNEINDLLRELDGRCVSESEITMLDKLVSNYLKYGMIVENSEHLNDLLLKIQSESFDNLEDTISGVENDIERLNTDIRSARESIEDSKHDMNLSDGGFVNILGNIINKERNPSSKVKTGIQYLNAMFNGGFEKG